MDVALAITWLRAAAEAVTADADELTRLDSAIGDGDHGVNMRRGFTAVTAVLDATEFTGVGDVFVRAGTALISKVGGAAGPLYGSAFRAFGKTLPAGPEVGLADLVTALHAGLDAVTRLGGAAPGDKTLVDAYRPALTAFEEAVAGGAALAEAAAGAARAAGDGARATISMTARKGRASYLGDRSAGHQDPGATSTWLIFQALADVTAP
ncbi:dihydroxyacetone kinase subunit DhaL [Actinoplanes sp. NEAU-A12]|uniref:Dihydroxyacetone kinase subunit DhaL n=1 Tax=Actinoplanes sandaracinus TaxID=3045177 RepID=A0ABT6WMM6_9ACTN|nr:dihydroxyacetone kinase subunit DhaL [Actinoplanes sandaracinus]MDI6100977.1 dihydroxyacetone kinase subunit DhaL [Actinoplanes sandaracinus]